MKIQRLINLNSKLAHKSTFLLGPRQTGKSWLIREQCQNAQIYNLLDSKTFRDLSLNPSLIRKEIKEENSLIVIDEIQKLPELLNEVHLLIEEKKKIFLLTGSSAIKLRRAGVNLLGGRASWLELRPLVKKELGQHFNLIKGMNQGFLPSIYFSKNYREDLKDYVDLYLREEIAVGTAIRRLPVFSRFLDIAALANGQVINYSNIGRDAQIPATTVREYFQVLVDSLLIDRIPVWKESKKRKAAAKDKFYFFDIGVSRYLQGRGDIAVRTEEFGFALEAYLYHELKSYSAYISGDKIAYWRTEDNLEVDFILGDHTAIEVKATQVVSPKHLKGLKAIAEEKKFKNYILVSTDERERRYEGIDIVPLEKFLDYLWDGKYNN